MLYYIGLKLVAHFLLHTYSLHMYNTLLTLSFYSWFNFDSSLERTCTISNMLKQITPYYADELSVAHTDCSHFLHSGIYMFAWTIVSLTGNTAYTDMYMNNVAIASAFANSNNALGAYSSSNTVVIHCESASRVFIQCSHFQACRYRDGSQVNAPLQSFTGYLISADD